MATKIEELRQQAQEAAAKVREERAKYDEDNLPSLDDVRRLEALTNAEADLADLLKATEGVLAIKPGARTAASSFPHSKGDREADGEKVDRRSLGRRFVELPEYAEWLKSVAPNGQIAQGVKVQSPPMKFAGLSDLTRHASLITGDSSTSGGAFVVADRFPELVGLGRRPLTIRDLVRVLQTGSDLVEYVRQTSRTNNAAIVAEATAASGSSGYKPESAAAFEVAQAPVKTIANWLPVTKQAVSDVPQMRGIIDTELSDNVNEQLETEMVTGSTFPGILQTSNIQTQAWDTNILTTTRKAKTKIRTVGRRVPSAYVLNPNDWQTIDLLQDNEARYLFGGPAAQTTPRLWGLPVVESEAITEGTGLTGDFRQAILWDREQASIAISDSHQDFFVRNLLAVLAELRAAFAATQPTAFISIDLTA